MHNTLTTVLALGLLLATIPQAITAASTDYTFKDLKRLPQEYQQKKYLDNAIGHLTQAITWTEQSQQIAASQGLDVTDEIPALHAERQLHEDTVSQLHPTVQAKLAALRTAIHTRRQAGNALAYLKLYAHYQDQVATMAAEEGTAQSQHPEAQAAWAAVTTERARLAQKQAVTARAAGDDLLHLTYLAQAQELYAQAQAQWQALATSSQCYQTQVASATAAHTTASQHHQAAKDSFSGERLATDYLHCTIKELPGEATLELQLTQHSPGKQQHWDVFRFPIADQDHFDPSEWKDKHLRADMAEDATTITLDYHQGRYTFYATLAANGNLTIHNIQAQDRSLLLHTMGDVTVQDAGITANRIYIQAQGTCHNRADIITDFLWLRAQHTRNSQKLTVNRGLRILEGTLANTGTITAQDTLHLNIDSASPTASFTNVGDVHAPHIRVRSNAPVDNSGTLHSNQTASWQINGPLKNSGDLKSASILDITSHELSNTGTIQADSDLTIDTQGYNLNNVGNLISLHHLAIGNIDQLINDKSIHSTGTATIDGNHLHNKGSIDSDRLTIEATTITNAKEAKILGRTLVLPDVKQLDNHGTLGTRAHASADPGKQGSLDTDAGSLTIDVHTANNFGLIAAEHVIFQLRNNLVNHLTGLINPLSQLTSSGPGMLDNQGSISTPGQLHLSHQKTTNNGLIQADIALTTSQHSNGFTNTDTGKVISSGKTLLNTAGSWNNYGLLQSTELAIDQPAFTNHHQVEAKAITIVNTTTLTNVSPEASITGSDVTFTHCGTFNNKGQLTARHALLGTIHTLNNEGIITVPTTLDLAVTTPLHHHGDIACTGQRCRLVVNSLDNQGTISGIVHNTDGSVAQTGNFVIEAAPGHINNLSGGRLLGGKHFNLTATDSIHNAGIIDTQGSGHLQSKHSFIHQGLLHTGGPLSIAAGSRVHFNQDSLARSEQGLDVRAKGAFHCEAANVFVDGDATVHAQDFLVGRGPIVYHPAPRTSGEPDQKQGAWETDSTLAASFSARGRMTVVVDRELKIDASIIAATGDISLQSPLINNQAHHLKDITLKKRSFACGDRKYWVAGPRDTCTWYKEFNYPKYRPAAIVSGNDILIKLAEDEEQPWDHIDNYFFTNTGNIHAHHNLTLTADLGTLSSFYNGLHDVHQRTSVVKQEPLGGFLLPMDQATGPNYRLRWVSPEESPHFAYALNYRVDYAEIAQSLGVSQDSLMLPPRDYVLVGDFQGSPDNYRYELPPIAITMMLQEKYGFLSTALGLENAAQLEAQLHKNAITFFAEHATPTAQGQAKGQLLALPSGVDDGTTHVLSIPTQDWTQRTVSAATPFTTQLQQENPDFFNFIQNATDPMLFYILAPRDEELVKRAFVWIPEGWYPALDHTEGYIGAEGDAHIQVDTVSNTGTIYSGKRIVIEAKELYNEQRVHEHLEHIHESAGFLKGTRMRTFTIRELQPGGNIEAVNVYLELDDRLENTGGTIFGKQRVEVITKRGDVINRMQIGTHLIHYKVGTIGKLLGKTQYSLAEDYYPGRIVSGGQAFEELFLIPPYALPNTENNGRGIYVYHDEEDTVMALLIHDTDNQETINLSTIPEFQEQLTHLTWPAAGADPARIQASDHALVNDIAARADPALQGFVSITAELGNILVEGSQVLGNSGVNMRAYGDIVLKNKVHVRTVADRVSWRGLSASSEKHEDYTNEPSVIQSARGSITLESTHGSNRITGSHFLASKNIELVAAEDNIIRGDTVTLKSSVSKSGLSGTTVQHSKTKYSQDVLLQSVLQAAGNITLSAGRDNHLEAVFTYGDGLVHLVAGRDNIIEGQDITQTADTQGWSFGVSFFGSDALNKLSRGEDLSSIVNSLAKEDPFYRVLDGLYKAQGSTGVTAATIQAAVEAFKLYTQIGKVIKNPLLSGGDLLGARLGLTDLEGNFNPRLNFRFGTFSSSWKQVQTVPSTIQARDIKIESKRNVEVKGGSQVHGENSLNVTAGGNITLAAGTTSTEHKSKSQGASISKGGGTPVSAGIDASKSKSSSTEYHNAALSGDTVTLHAEGHIELDGATITGNSTTVSGASLSAKTKQDTLEASSKGGGLDSAGSGSAHQSKESAAIAKTVSSIEGKSMLIIDIAGDVFLQGAQLLGPDDESQQINIGGEFTYEDVHDHHTQKGFDIAVSLPVSDFIDREDVSKKRNEAIYQDKRTAMQDLRSPNWFYGSINARYTRKSFKALHHAMVSKGMLGINSGDLSGLARDLSSAYEVVEDKESDITVYVPLLNLGKLFKQVREVNQILSQGESATNDDLAKLESFNQELAVLGYELAEDTNNEHQSNTDNSQDEVIVNQEPEATDIDNDQTKADKAYSRDADNNEAPLTVSLGELEDEEGNIVHVGIIEPLTATTPSPQPTSIEVTADTPSGQEQTNPAPQSQAMLTDIRELPDGELQITFHPDTGEAILIRGQRESVEKIFSDSEGNSLLGHNVLDAETEEAMEVMKRLVYKFRDGFFIKGPTETIKSSWQTIKAITVTSSKASFMALMQGIVSAKQARDWISSEYLEFSLDPQGYKEAVANSVGAAAEQLATCVGEGCTKARDRIAQEVQEFADDPKAYRDAVVNKAQETYKEKITRLNKKLDTISNWAQKLPSSIANKISEWVETRNTRYDNALPYLIEQNPDIAPQALQALLERQKMEDYAEDIGALTFDLATMFTPALPAAGTKWGTKIHAAHDATRAVNKAETAASAITKAVTSAEKATATATQTVLKGKTTKAANNIIDFTQDPLGRSHLDSLKATGTDGAHGVMSTTTKQTTIIPQTPQPIAAQSRTAAITIAEDTAARITPISGSSGRVATAKGTSATTAKNSLTQKTKPKNKRAPKGKPKLGPLSKPMVKEAQRLGFQLHHIISHTHSDTKNHPFLKLANFDLQDPANLILLPAKAEALAMSARTLHRGRHLGQVSEKIGEVLDDLVKVGETLRWTQKEYKDQLMLLLQKQRFKLKKDRILLNNAKR